MIQETLNSIKKIICLADTHPKGTMCTVVIFYLITTSIVILKVKLVWAELLICGILFIPIMIIIINIYSKKQASSVQVIAWHGWEENEIWEGMRKQKPDILTYVGSFELPSRLMYRNSLFDVIVADLEFLPGYFAGAAIMNLKNFLKSPSENITWRTHFDNTVGLLNENEKLIITEVADRSDKFVMGLPMEFAFQEILLNDKAKKLLIQEERDRLLPHHDCPPYLRPLSYKTFGLNALLEKEDLKIGLWNWYLPTLSILLLIEGSDIANLWNTGASVRPIIDKIKDHKDQFRLLDDQRSVYASFKSGIDIVLGAGSWALPNRDAGSEYILQVIPKEGIIAWATAAAVLNRPDAGKGVIHGLLDYLRTSKAQTAITEGNERRSLAAEKSVFKQQLTQMHPLSESAKILLGENGNVKYKDDVRFRQKPKDWFHWESVWRELQDKLDHIISAN